MSDLHREVVVIDSQPSASRPRNPRIQPRRLQPQHRASTLKDLGLSARWKVQLELVPSEIALVYRQGLARGAEVCRRGSQEWRPLVTTPELRTALARPPSFYGGAEILTRPGSSLTLTHTLEISDPSLAKLLFARQPPTILPVLTPPPPPVVLTRAAAVPESAVTQPLPGRASPSTPPESWSTDFTPTDLTPAVPARPRWLELSFVASASMAATLMVMLLASHLLSGAGTGPLRGMETLGASPENDALAAPQKVSSFGPGPAIPVVPLHELAVEHGSAGAGAATGAHYAGNATGAAEVGPNRGALARALARASQAAQSCGPGPVNAQVIATFGPSGVARSVQFGAGAPPTSLRSCVLNAVARVHIAPFEGPPVTVSKTVRW
jgi:hypothetical protein